MFLGIEIGGTKLQIGLGEGNGMLAGLWRGDVEVQGGAEGIRKQILTAIPELLQTTGIKKSRIKAVGIGFGGPVDDATRTVIKSHQIEGWDRFPLAEWISDSLGWPAVLANDADVAGLAEALFGAGKDLSPIFYITIGSGIGGGLIIDGEIYRGCGRGAAEIGHLNVFIPTGLSDDFEYWTLECFSSGWALEKKARHWVSRQAASRHSANRHATSQVMRLAHENAEQITCRHLAVAAQQGDEMARMLLHTAIRQLAVAIVHVITLL